MERYKLRTLLMSEKDVKVFMEALWHAAQRADIPADDQLRARDLRERLGECFKKQGE